MEHQRESDDEIDNREAFVLYHQAEKHHREGDVRQHVRRQSRENVGARGVRCHKAESVVVLRQRIRRFGVELVYFFAEEEASDEHVRSFMRHGLHDVEVFSEKKSRDDDKSHHSDAKPHISLICVGFKRIYDIFATSVKLKSRDDEREHEDE